MIRKPLNEANYDLYALFKRVREVFYSLLNKLANSEYIINNNSKDIFDQLKKLENFLLIINDYLKNFNENQDKISSISDKYIINLIYTNQMNINRNYNLVDIEFIINNLSIKLNNFDYINRKEILYNKANLLQHKQNNNNNNQIITQPIDEQDIKNYINQNKFKLISFKIVHQDKEPKSHPIIAYFEFELKNFFIKLIPQKPNNVVTQSFTLESRYNTLYNTLLLRKIHNELSKVIEFLYIKFINRENNGLNFLKSFINHIQDLDKIFYIKCYGCKKNSRYSHFEKSFFPPFIKYNIEMYFYKFKFPNNDKDKLFFHPECLD